MFADPQSITISGSAIPLPRTLTGTDTGKFISADQKTSLEVRTTRAGRTRSSVRLLQKKVTADPLVATTNVMVNDVLTLTINRPADGFSDSDVLAQAKGFIAWLTAGSDANLIKLIAGEN